MDALLTDTALWGAILGLLTPLVTSLAQQPTWTRTVRTLVGVLTSAAVGLLTVLSTGAAGEGLVTAATLTATIISGQLAYSRFWRGTGVVEKLELASSPAKTKLNTVLAVDAATGRYALHNYPATPGSSRL